MPDPTQEIVVYVWPEKWNLPSLQPESLAVILALQLAIPGEFIVKYCSNPDLSPSGQLPYLDIGGAYISSIQSIFRQINQLRPQATRGDYTNSEGNPSGVDAFLSRKQSTQKTAWIAYVQAHLGDIVAHTFYASSDNYNNLTRPTISSLLPLPQRYYVSDRIRASYKPRLESVGLWEISNDEDQSAVQGIGTMMNSSKEESEKKLLHKKAVAKERLLDHARASLDVISRTLDTNLFFFADRSSTLDALIAAHILLLLDPPFSDTTIRDLLNTSYPSLTQHARRVFDLAIGLNSTPLRFASLDNNWAGAIQSLAPKWPWSQNSEQSSMAGRSKIQKSDEDKRWDAMRWGWYALAGASTVAWIFFGGIRLTIVDDVDEDEENDADVDDNEDDEGIEGDSVYLEEEDDED